MKKTFTYKIFKYLLPIVLLIGVYFGVKHYTQPTAEYAAKTITLTVKIALADETTEIGQLEVKSSAPGELLTLGDVLDKVNKTSTEFKFTLNGSKFDSYGRFVSAINDRLADSSLSQFWSIESTTNKECLAAGFCSGVDLQMVHDADTFDFILTKW